MEVAPIQYTGQKTVSRITPDNGTSFIKKIELDSIEYVNLKLEQTKQNTTILLDAEWANYGPIRQCNFGLE